MKFKEYLKNDKLDESGTISGDGWSCSARVDEKVYIDVNFQQIQVGERVFSYVDVGQRLPKDLPKEIREKFWDVLNKNMTPVYDQMKKRQTILEEEVKRIVETTHTLLKAKAAEAFMEFKHGQEKVIDATIKQQSNRVNKNETRKLSKRK